MQAAEAGGRSDAACGLSLAGLCGQYHSESLGLAPGAFDKVRQVAYVQWAGFVV